MALTIARIPEADDAVVSIALAYGANLLTLGRFARANGDAQATEVAALDEISQTVSPIFGRLKQLSWNTASADATTVVKVHVGGVVAETITLTGAVGSADLTLESVGQEVIAIEYDAGTAPGNGNYQVEVIA